CRRQERDRNAARNKNSAGESQRFVLGGALRRTDPGGLRVGGAGGRSARTGSKAHAFRCGWRRWQRQARGDGESSLSDAGVARRAVTGDGAGGSGAARVRSGVKENPNRYRGLYGAARAAEAGGDQEKAASYFAKLVTLSKNADTDRPEIAQAKTFLAKQ